MGVFEHGKKLADLLPVFPPVDQGWQVGRNDTLHERFLHVVHGKRPLLLVVDKEIDFWHNPGRWL